MNGTYDKRIVDAGPLVALFNRSDPYHKWAVARFGVTRSPSFSCEAALSESMLLLERRGVDPIKPMEIVERGAWIARPN